MFCFSISRRVHFGGGEAATDKGENHKRDVEIFDENREGCFFADLTSKKRRKVVFFDA